MGERRNGEDYGDSDDKDVRSGYTGYVKMYSTIKGWGFIICKEVEKDVFFHVRNILDGPPRQDIDSTKGEYWEAEFDVDLTKPNNPTAWRIRLWQKAHGNRQPQNAAAALASSSSYNYYQGRGGASGGGGGQSSSSHQSSGRPWRTASSTGGDTYSSQGGGSSSSDWHKPKRQEWDSSKDYKADKWGSNSNSRGGGGGGGGGGWGNSYSSDSGNWGYNSSSSWNSKAAAPTTSDYDDRYETELLKPGRRARQEVVQADDNGEGRYRSYRDSQATSEPATNRASRGDRDFPERGGERDRDHAGRWGERDRERDRGDSTYGRDRQREREREQREREQRDSGYRDRDYQQQDTKQQRGDYDYRDNNSRGGVGRGSERGSRGPDRTDPPPRPRGASDGRGGSGSFADVPERGGNSYNHYRERIPRDGGDTRDRGSRAGGGGAGDAYQSSSARDFADRGRDGRERDRRDEKKPWRDGANSGATAEDDRRDRRRSSGMGVSSTRGAAGGASAGSRSRATVPLPPPRSSAASLQAQAKKPPLPRRSLPSRSREERRSRSPRRPRRSPPPSGQPKSKASAGPLRADIAQLPPGDWEGGSSHYMVLVPPSAAEAFDLREAVEIEKRSGVRLKLHRSEYRNTGDRILEVEADVGHALKDAMLRIIREVVRHKGGRLADGNCELRVLLTRPVASSVIGVKGRNVQSINAITGCRVQVSTTDRDATMQTSVIRGPDASSILQVCSIIHTFIQNPSWPRSHGGHTSRPWSTRDSRGGSRPEESGGRRHQDASQDMVDAAEEERADAAVGDAMADVNDDMANQHHDEEAVEGTCELDPYVQVDDEEGYDQGPDGDAPFFDETVVVENLPYPWVAVEHPEEPGTFYYHNEETGEATWYPPAMDGGAEGGGEYQDEPEPQQAKERSRSRSRLSIRNEDI